MSGKRVTVKLGTLQDGVVDQWLKKPGDPVEADEPIVLISLDKCEVEIASPVTGYLDELLVPAGATVQPDGQLAAVIEDRPPAGTAISARELDLGALLRARAARAPAFTARHGVPLDLLGFFVLALHHALIKAPGLRMTLPIPSRRDPSPYDFRVAFAGCERIEPPLLRGVPLRSFASIVTELHRLERAWRTEPTPAEEPARGAFTIRDERGYGATFEAPLVPPGHAAALALCAIVERPIAREGCIAIRPMMNAVLAYDRSAATRSAVAAFFDELQRRLADPLQLMGEG